MAQDFDDSFETESGINFGGAVGVFAGNVEPWLVPINNAPIGSRYFRTDNTQYQKIGTGDLETDWEKVSRASFGAAPLTLTFTSFNLKQNDFLDIGKITNSDAAQAVPYDTILTGVAVAYKAVNAPGIDIHLYKDGVDQGSIITLTTSLVNGVQSNTSLNISLPALSRVKLRAGTGAGSVDIAVVNLVLEGA